MKNITPNKAKRLLIVGPSWVGDMVMAQSLLKLLRRQQPDVTITVMAPAWSRALIDRMPEVDTDIESPFGHGEVSLARRWRLGRQLAGQFDVAYVLPNSFKSALVPFFAGIPRRIGWQGELRNALLNDCRSLDTVRYPLMVERFVALALREGEALPAYDRPKLQTDSRQAEAVAVRLGVRCSGRVLAICPGAEFGDSKQWPLEHYAELCNLAVRAGWQVWILGSPNDREAGSRVLSAVMDASRTHCFDLTGKTSLADVIDLLSLATATVTNDSGLMHIAAAVGSPLVAIYGSSSPDFTPPLGERVQSLTTAIDCRPCFKRRCPLGHKRCLTEIAPVGVFGSLQDLLSP
jgi:heptosyltransferase-2